MADPDPSLPPVVPKSRSGIPVVAGILAVAGAAVGFWLVRGKGPDSPAPAPAPAKPAATTPAMVVRDAPPPPPPPPPEEPEQKAAPQAVASKKSAEAPKVVAEEQGPCGGTCKGQDTPELQSALRARAGQARSCYERALSTNSALTGKLVIAARITPQGTACRASVQEDSLGDSGVTRCVVQRFQSGTYPKPQGNGCVDVAVPINFVPRQ
jgi:outer membrane biosynthesis protein TonB